MSLRLVNVVLKLALPIAEQLVMLKLANYSDDQGYLVFLPKTEQRQDTFAHWCGCSERTLRKILADLERRGLLTRLSTGQYRSLKHYRVTLDEKRQDLPDLETSNPAGIAGPLLKNRQSLPDQPAEFAGSDDSHLDLSVRDVREEYVGGADAPLPSSKAKTPKPKPRPLRVGLTGPAAPGEYAHLRNTWKRHVR